MAVSWQDVATQQAEQLAARLKELLSSGLGYLNSELGVDLGLKPDLIPPWVILSTACLGLLVILVVWGFACRGLLRGRSKRTIETIEETVKPAVKSSKPEDQKKKSKKKPSEKKPQANGRPVAEQEVKVTEEIPAVQQPTPDNKSDKAKNKKKKPKPASAPETQSAPPPRVKEPEPEGSWETKVSNREKRQQKRKEKGAGDSSPSPGGDDSPANPSPAPEAAKPTNQKKSKGDTPRAKPAKAEPVAPQAKVTAQVEETPAMNGGEWNNVGLKPQKQAPKAENWTALPKKPVQPNPEVSVWGQEIEGWTVVDRGIPSAFPGLGLAPSAVEPQPVAELQWATEPPVDDEWSGLNGSSADPASDWSAPAEVWGNYEEPEPETPAPPPEQPASTPLTNTTEDAQGSDDEKDKADSAAAESGKGKKKKKKKKKAEEETGTAQEEVKESPVEVAPPPQPAQATAKAAKAAKTAKPAKPSPAPVEAEPPRAAVQEKAVPKIPSQVPQGPADAKAPAKQPSGPAPGQDKPEAKQESPVQAKKKRARRET
ncbi:protein LYRIC isoform X2 [Clupea harengus]|uniref:Protein LYRIC isoform X2 n=1 Tax=Clupea harengus TaxID=7950 RepID=A0A6P8FWG2_CLUHA|nr:protein LYRIC isoform X2 [Clupea harengus]